MRGWLLVGTAILAAAASGSPRLGAQNARAIPASLYAGLTWQCTGPFDGGPIASVEGVAGEPGVYVITTPSGGAWKTIDGGDSWTSIDRTSVRPVAGADPERWIDPANPRRIVRVDAPGIAVSLDAGGTWTSFHRLPIAEVTRLAPHEHPVESSTRRQIDGTPVGVSIADPARAGLIFAGTKTSVYVSFDNGVEWAPLQLNMPAVAINDLDIRGNDLIAATQGRSIWTLADISPLRQIDRASASAAALLFKPVDAVLGPEARVDLDYALGASATGPVLLDVLDAAGHLIHAASSVAPDPADRWLPVALPLATTRGHHRVVWRLRFDPPPSPNHRFAQLARALYEHLPANPDGPQVLAGSYRVRLTVGGRQYLQPLVVRNEASATPASLEARRQQFDLAMKAYDAMSASHRGFLRLKRVRSQIAPLLRSTDPDIAAAATDLDTRLAAIDGSDWTGLVIPDADNDASEADEDAKEGKHPDFVPPKAVPLSKDYDDPTTILGRAFANVDHAPAFAILSTTLGEVVTKTDAASAPDALTIETYDRSCQQLAGVLDAWRAINAQDLPRLNEALAKRMLPPVAIAANLSSISCSPK
jgi:hypothetical protein